MFRMVAVTRGLVNNAKHAGSLLLLSVLLHAPGVAQESGCPIRLQKVELLPKVSRSPLAAARAGNQEMTIRVRYKNVSQKTIDSGRVLVETFLLMEAPNHQDMQKDTQSLLLPRRLSPGQSSTTNVKVFSSPGMPRAWLTEVDFADGSHWSSSDSLVCLYEPHHRAVSVTKLPSNSLCSEQPSGSACFCEGYCTTRVSFTF